MTTYWHDDVSQHPPVGTWMWHLHHEVLAEPLTAPLVNRLRYIRKNKPPAERPTRLGCIDVIRGEIPAALVTASAAWVKASAAWVKAYAARITADAAWDKAKAAWLPEFEALHAIEHPDCPWDGKTIFPVAK